MLLALLAFILLALVVIERELDSIRKMIGDIWRCPECHGSGTLPKWDEFAGEKCRTCRGTGWRTV